MSCVHWRHSDRGLASWLACCFSLIFAAPVAAQMGGMGGGPGGGMGGAQAPAADTRPRFKDHIHEHGGMTFRREKGDKIVRSVRLIGNRRITAAEIDKELHTRRGRFYQYQTVLADVRRLNDLGFFERVTFEIEDVPATPDPGAKSGSSEVAGVIVTFRVSERPMISTVVYHGNYRVNDRDLKGRSGVSQGDPLNEFAIESGRRRLVDYYRGEGFNQVSIESTTGTTDDPEMVIFRINEGPKERISAIHIEGNQVVSRARLKKIIQSRGPMVGVIYYLGNTANMEKIRADEALLATYYQNLGFLTVNVGTRLEYDETGTWLTVTYVIKEGPRFRIGDIQIVGNDYIKEESLRRRLELAPGDMFSGTIMRADIGQLIYGYGELGFIYAEVEPKTIMRDENGTVDLVYEITEGDRWKIGHINVLIDGEPHLMRETTMLNLINMREGDFIDRRQLELGRRRIERSQLLETNPQVAEPPDIKVVPLEEVLR
ncbi:MAG: POTRA domain-containing protein [Planctomycetota bacterium]